MNKSIKTILNLLVIILFLVLLVNLMAGAFLGIWLQTYKAFTSKTLVAEISLSEQKHEGEIPYTDVTLKQVQGGVGQTIIYSDPQSYKVYGNEVRIGGQVIKFQDVLTLIGVKTVYKVTRLEGSFLDATQELNSPRSVYDLNGGVDPVYVFLQNNEDTFKFVIETTMGDYPGKNVQGSAQTYGLFVTEEGFLLEKI